MTEFELGGKKYPIAEGFNDLSLEQLHAYVKDVYLEMPRIFSMEDGKAKVINPQLLDEKYMALFTILLNFDLELATLLTVPQPLLDDAGEAMLQEDGSPLTFSNAHFLIFEMKVCNFFFETFLTRNPYPVIKARGRTLIGPSDNFTNIRIEEYFYADKLYLAYRKTKKEEYLDRLIAAIYRPAAKGKSREDEDYDGDDRIPFNEHHLLPRAEMVKDLDPDKKLLLFVWYEGCRNELIRNYELLYAGADTEGTISLRPEEELVSLCGGWEKYNTTKHFKLKLLMNDLQASAKRALNSKKP